MPPISAMAVEVSLGAAVPNTSASQPSLKSGNSNLANTPPATGALAPAQSPSGTPVTNTNRTVTATAQSITTNRGHSLFVGGSGWNGVRTPLNPV